MLRVWFRVWGGGRRRIYVVHSGANQHKQIDKSVVKTI